MKKFLSLLVLLTACFSLSITTSAKIPQSASIHNNHAYKVYNTSMTWQEAKSYCERLGGHLVTITSEEEQNFITKLSQNKGMNLYWTGLYRTYIGGTWQWITGENFDYTNWAKAEPNNDKSKNEFYVGIFGKRYQGATGNWKELGTWNDMTNIGAHYDSYGVFYNLSNIGFICEWDTTKTSINKAKIKLSKTTYTYNGKNCTPSVTVKLNGKKLVKDRDFTLIYIANKYPGVGHVKIEGTGNYNGTINKYFKITPKKVTGFKLKATGSKEFTATWKSMNYITGYQLQYVRGFTKRTVKLSGNEISKTISNLKSGKYSVRIRAYATTGGRTSYGKWTTIKRVKVAK